MWMVAATLAPLTRRCDCMSCVCSVKYGHFDILEDEEVRQGLKKFSNWPTYPQLYIGGELIGGLDIVKASVFHYLLLCFCSVLNSTVSKHKKDDFHTYSVQSEIGKRAIKFKGSKLWNNLPSDIKEIQSSSSFKYRLWDYYNTVYWVIWM